MATIQELKVKITCEVKKTKRVHEGPWCEAFGCMECEDIDYRSHSVCPKCGTRERREQIVARWVRVKTGFWPWQVRGYYEAHVRRTKARG